MSENRLQLSYFLGKLNWIVLLNKYTENLCKARDEWAQNFDIRKINMQLVVIYEDLPKRRSSVFVKDKNPPL